MIVWEWLGHCWSCSRLWTHLVPTGHSTQNSTNWAVFHMYGWVSEIFVTFKVRTVRVVNLMDSQSDERAVCLLYPFFFSSWPGWHLKGKVLVLAFSLISCLGKIRQLTAEFDELQQFASTTAFVATVFTVATTAQFWLWILTLLGHLRMRSLVTS